jgi:hypothetical protein
MESRHLPVPIRGLALDRGEAGPRVDRVQRLHARVRLGEDDVEVAGDRQQLEDEVAVEEGQVAGDDEDAGRGRGFQQRVDAGEGRALGEGRERPGA